MKTKSDVNRSDKIREYLASAKPSEKGPKAVAEALKAKGINVSTALVSQVKNRLEGKKARRKSIKTKAVVRRRRNSSRFDLLGTTAHLVRAKDFLKSFGGDLNKAKVSLDVVSKLIS